MSFQRLRDGLTLSDDATLIDVDAVIRLLRGTYWATQRPEETIRASLTGSRGFGVRDQDGILLGFCRAVTDGATFAWLCDVVVDPGARGRGIGTWMVGEVIDGLRACGVPRIVLRTRDAHGLYRKFGFTELGEVDTWMEAATR